MHSGRELSHADGRNAMGRPAYLRVNGPSVRKTREEPFASLPSGSAGSIAAARPSCSSRLVDAPVQSSSRPRWKRTVGASGKRRASGPRRENAADGSSLSKRPTAAATRLRVVRGERGRLVVGAPGRQRPAEPLERHAVLELLGRTPVGRPRRRARRAGGRRAGDAIRSGKGCDGTNTGRPRGVFGWSRSSARTAESVSGSSRSASRHCSSRLRPRAGPEEREPEVEPDERAPRVLGREPAQRRDRALAASARARARPAPPSTR